MAELPIEIVAVNRADGTPAPVVVVGMPLRDQDANHFATTAFFDTGEVITCRALSISSLLTTNFNTILVSALNGRETQGVTHMAMIHGDVCPDHGWLKTLLTEMESTGADLMSAVVPIRGSSGKTSTALETDDPWRPRKLSLKEVFDRDETFTDPKLLVNSGLILIDVTKPMWRTPRPPCFVQSDEVVQVFEPQKDGPPKARYVNRSLSEDWYISREIRKLGGRVFATRKVGLFHDRREWHNRHPWGEDC